MSVGVVLAVAVACGLTGVVRYALSLAAAHGSFPWPTIVVNTVGTAVLGSALAAFSSGGLSLPAYVVIGAGVAGGLTTFSTLSVDAVRLWTRGRRPAFWAYLGVTLGLGLLASWAAWTATMALAG